MVNVSFGYSLLTSRNMQLAKFLLDYQHEQAEATFLADVFKPKVKAAVMTKPIAF